MIRALLGSLSLLVALILGWAAFSLFFRCFLPWWKAPDTTHMTLIFAGTQFTGWQLFVPFAVLATVAVAIAIFGLWTLKTRA
jgi:hypothetical protein